MSRTNNAVLSANAVLEAMRSSIRILTIGMIALVLFYLCSGITVIRPNEVAIVMRFGKIISYPHPPGLLFAFPSPVDEVIRIPVKTLQELALDLWAAPIGSEMFTSLNPVNQPYSLTGDVNIIQARFVVRYEISDPVNYLISANDREKLLNGILYESATQALSSMTVEDAITVRKNQIGQEAMQLAQKRIDALNLGILLSAFETREITPPFAVLSAFQAVVSAKVKAKTLIEEANAFAASTIPDATAQAYRIKEEAESFANQKVAIAHGESDSFLSILSEERKYPRIVRARLYGETLSLVMPRVKVSTLVSGGSTTSKILLEPQKGTTPISN
jgi:membrane protease subunit HflK